jgi:hypothetical protein
MVFEYPLWLVRLVAKVRTGFRLGFVIAGVIAFTSMLSFMGCSVIAGGAAPLHGREGHYDVYPSLRKPDVVHPVSPWLWHVNRALQYCWGVSLLTFFLFGGMYFLLEWGYKRLEHGPDNARNPTQPTVLGSEAPKKGKKGEEAGK